MLGLRVERAGRLVEHQHRRVAQDRAGDRDALLLAAGEAVAALADDRVVARPAARRPDRGSAPCARPPRSPASLASGLREAQVLAHGRVEQVGLLRDDADRRGERGERRVADVDTVDRDAARLRLIQARDEVAERRLARRRSRRRSPCACPAGTTRSDVVQRPRRVLAVAEADVLETHLAEQLARAAARPRPAPRRCRPAGRGTRRSGRTARAKPRRRCRPRAAAPSGRAGGSAAS